MNYERDTVRAELAEVKLKIVETRMLLESLYRRKHDLELIQNMSTRMAIPRPHPTPLLDRIKNRPIPSEDYQRLEQPPLPTTAEIYEPDMFDGYPRRLKIVPKTVCRTFGIYLGILRF